MTETYHFPSLVRLSVYHRSKTEGLQLARRYTRALGDAGLGEVVAVGLDVEPVQGGLEDLAAAAAAAAAADPDPRYFVLGTGDGTRIRFVRFDEDGRWDIQICQVYPDGGPPPEPLDRLQVRVRDGKVEIETAPTPLTLTKLT